MKIYESKPWYLWIILLILTYGFILIISPFDLYFTIFMGVIIGIVGLKTKKIEFYADIVCKNYIFRPQFLVKKYCFDYQKITLIEVRKRKEPYNRPYVILHFSLKKINSLFFANRSFLFDSVSELEPLIEHSIKKNIPIKLNFTPNYQTDEIFLKKIIEKNKGEIW